MAKKIVFIGAGSFTFTRNLTRDILTFDAFKDADLWLVDINPDNLEIARTMVQRIVDLGNYPAKVHCTLDRVEALKGGADGVLCTILVGTPEVVRLELDIPYKYGIDACVGDTRGPWGIFRYLRTVPEMLNIAGDIVKYAPDAIFLNYTNPMAMLCRTIQAVYPQLKTTGLCHSVQGTAEMLARWIGADMDDVTYTCAGINHLAFYLEYKVKGKDAYPLIREAIAKPEIYNEEQVRNEMCRHLGYYVTESSGHNSEYNPWFRKREDLKLKYCTHGTGWNPGESYRHWYDDPNAGMYDRKKELENWLKEDVDLARGHEYAAYIFNACFGDGTLFEFNGNVRNFGLIDNLPEGACVEVPVLASKGNLQPMAVGKMPPQLALLDNWQSQIEELAVEASLTGDRSKVLEAIYFDPMCSAKLSLQEIKDMVDEMFEAINPYLPQFN
ncbi:MAG: alpha-glucosidase/alpha-galactosidase [Christensenellales bacterium]|jgi:alpha-galactosidase